MTGDNDNGVVAYNTKARRQTPYQYLWVLE